MDASGRSQTGIQPILETWAVFHRKGKYEMLLNEKTSQNANAAGAVQVTVNTFKPAENKGILSHLGRIFKNDIVGFFSEVRNIIRQTEGLEAYATCKQSGVCSDAIEEYHVHIPPMYDEILTDKPVAPTPGAATLDALTSVAQATGSILDDTGSMEAFANRHQSFPGDPTKFDANRPQARMFAQVDERIRSRVTVVEELKKEA